jgi:bifunctional DNase/RNase
MLKQMKIEGLLFDPRSNMYILLLKEINGNDTLPIWIGRPEADSIALAVGKIATPRPLTHDLVKNVLEGLDTSVKRIVVRMNSPIFVEKHVIESRNNDELEEWLRNLKPEDFENVM